MRLIIGKQNTYSYQFTPGNGTLVINGLLNLDVNLNNPACLGSILSIYDVTAGIYLPLNNTLTLSESFNASIQTDVYTLTWSTLPGGLSNNDVLLITINVSLQWAIYSLLQYQKA